MSSIFYSTHLSDIFSYENTNINKLESDKKLNNSFISDINKKYSYIVVYNFHSLYSQDRFFIFVVNNTGVIKSRVLSNSTYIDSISELFVSHKNFSLH